MKSFIVMGFCYISPGINETRTSLYRQSTEAARQWQMLAGNETYPASCFLLVHPFPCTSTRATFRIPECMFLLAGKNMPGLKKIAHETRNSKTVLDWLGYCCSRTTVKTGLICQKKQSQKEKERKERKKASNTGQGCCHPVVDHESNSNMS